MKKKGGRRWKKWKKKKKNYIGPFMDWRIQSKMYRLKISNLFLRWREKVKPGRNSCLTFRSWWGVQTWKLELRCSLWWSTKVLVSLYTSWTYSARLMNRAKHTQLYNESSNFHTCIPDSRIEHWTSPWIRILLAESIKRRHVFSFKSQRSIVA